MLVEVSNSKSRHHRLQRDAESFSSLEGKLPVGVIYLFVRGGSHALERSVREDSADLFRSVGVEGIDLPKSLLLRKKNVDIIEDSWDGRWVNAFNYTDAAFTAKVNTTHKGYKVKAGDTVHRVICLMKPPRHDIEDWKNDPSNTLSEEAKEVMIRNRRVWSVVTVFLTPDEQRKSQLSDEALYKYPIALNEAKPKTTSSYTGPLTRDRHVWKVETDIYNLSGPTYAIRHGVVTSPPLSDSPTDTVIVAFDDEVGVSRFSERRMPHWIKPTRDEAIQVSLEWLDTQVIPEASEADRGKFQKFRDKLASELSTPDNHSDNTVLGEAVLDEAKPKFFHRELEDMAKKYLADLRSLGVTVNDAAVSEVDDPAGASGYTLEFSDHTGHSVEIWFWHSGLQGNLMAEEARVYFKGLPKSERFATLLSMTLAEREGVLRRYAKRHPVPGRSRRVSAYWMDVHLDPMDRTSNHSDETVLGESQTGHPFSHLEQALEGKLGGYALDGSHFGDSPSFVRPVNSTSTMGEYIQVSYRNARWFTLVAEAPKDYEVAGVDPDAFEDSDNFACATVDSLPVSSVSDVLIWLFSKPMGWLKTALPHLRKLIDAEVLNKSSNHSDETVLGEAVLDEAKFQYTPPQVFMQRQKDSPREGNFPYWSAKGDYGSPSYFWQINHLVHACYHGLEEDVKLWLTHPTLDPKVRSHQTVNSEGRLGRRNVNPAVAAVLGDHPNILKLLSDAPGIRKTRDGSLYLRYSEDPVYVALEKKRRECLRVLLTSGWVLDKEDSYLLSNDSVAVKQILTDPAMKDVLVKGCPEILVHLRGQASRVAFKILGKEMPLVDPSGDFTGSILLDQLKLGVGTSSWDSLPWTDSDRSQRRRSLFGTIGYRDSQTAIQYLKQPGVQPWEAGMSALRDVYRGPLNSLEILEGLNGKAVCMETLEELAGDIFKRIMDWDQDYDVPFKVFKYAVQSRTLPSDRAQAKKILEVVESSRDRLHPTSWQLSKLVPFLREVAHEGTSNHSDETVLGESTLEDQTEKFTPGDTVWFTTVSGFSKETSEVTVRSGTLTALNSRIGSLWFPISTTSGSSHHIPKRFVSKTKDEALYRRIQVVTEKDMDPELKEVVLSKLEKLITSPINHSDETVLGESKIGAPTHPLPPKLLAYGPSQSWKNLCTVADELVSSGFWKYGAVSVVEGAEIFDLQPTKGMCFYPNDCLRFMQSPVSRDRGWAVAWSHWSQVQWRTDTDAEKADRMLTPEGVRRLNAAYTALDPLRPHDSICNSAWASISSASLSAAVKLHEVAKESGWSGAWYTSPKPSGGLDSTFHRTGESPQSGETYVSVDGASGEIVLGVEGGHYISVGKDFPFAEAIAWMERVPLAEKQRGISTLPLIQTGVRRREVDPDAMAKLIQSQLYPDTNHSDETVLGESVNGPTLFDLADIETPNDLNGYGHAYSDSNFVVYIRRLGSSGEEEVLEADEVGPGEFTLVAAVGDCEQGYEGKEHVTEINDLPTNKVRDIILWAMAKAPGWLETAIPHLEELIRAEVLNKPSNHSDETVLGESDNLRARKLEAAIRYGDPALIALYS